MIIKGSPRRSVAFWAQHLTRADGNERVSVLEMRGIASTDVRGALSELQAIAEGTRAKNGFYVASLNPCEDEQLTPEQWDKAKDIFLQTMRLDNQPFFIVEHEKDGRTHRHIVAGRVDPDTMTVIPADGNYKKHQQASRTIERELGLRVVESVQIGGRESERPERRPRDYEGFRAVDTGIDPQLMKAEITKLWQRADSGQAFKAALEDAGYILAKGDRRDFVIIDPAGDDHSLARRISGEKAAGIRARMEDIDRDGLPSVAEGRQMARDATGSTDGGNPNPEAKAAPAPAADDLRAAIEAEEARQLGGPAELTQNIEHDLAARFGDSFAQALQEARAGGPTGTVVEQATRDAAPLQGDVAASAATEFLPEPRGWRERLRALGEAALRFLHDETSGTPEGGRDPFTRVFDAGRELWQGARRGDGRELGRGIEDTAELARELADRHADAAPGKNGGAGESEPPHEMSWVERVSRGAVHLGERISSQWFAGSQAEGSEAGDAAEQPPSGRGVTGEAHADGQPHAPPNDHPGDLPRPGGIVETPEPDEGPQTQAAPPAGAAAALDAHAPLAWSDAWPEPDEEEWLQAETEEQDILAPDDGGTDGPDLD